jgi:hypothetical protein
VKSAVTIHAKELPLHSDSWGVEIYDLQYRTVATYKSKTGESRNTISLAPGWYEFLHRFYTDGDALYCPEIVIDNGSQVIESRIFPNEKQDFEKILTNLRKERNPSFLWQQYYIFHWVKTMTEDNEEKVRNEFLPMGDPHTIFVYEFLPKDTLLALSISSESLSHYRVYVQYLNEMSLPVYWTQVLNTEWRGEKSQEDGAYFIRFVPRGKTDPSHVKPEYQCSLQS